MPRELRCRAEGCESRLQIGSVFCGEHARLVPAGHVLRGGELLEVERLVEVGWRSDYDDFDDDLDDEIPIGR